jgi:hypothetical protein
MNQIILGEIESHTVTFEIPDKEQTQEEANLSCVKEIINSNKIVENETYLSASL